MLKELITDPKAREFWKNNLWDTYKVNATIGVFRTKFLTYFGLTDEFHEEFIKTPAFEAFSSLLADASDIVSIESFSKICNIFGPLNDLTICDFILSVLQEGWFWGDMHPLIAEKLFEKNFIKGVKNNFLVRFSSDNKSITLTVCDQYNKITHYRIEKRGPDFIIGNTTDKSLVNIINKLKYQLGLEDYIKGSKFEKQFKKANYGSQFRNK